MTAMVGILLAVAAVIGFAAGNVYRIAARAWQDYRKTKAAVPVLLRAFWAAVRAALLVVVVALIWFVGSVYVAATADTGPQPSPSPSPSPSPTRSR